MLGVFVLLGCSASKLGQDSVEMFGLSVDVDEISIDVRSGGLVGTLPTQVGLLQSLFELDVAFNSISGTLPTQLGLVTSLALWDMSNNMIRGTIPSELAQLSELIIWQVGNNQLTGTIPSQIGRLQNLADWFLENNRLSGLIPSQTYFLRSLNKWQLQNNEFTGSLPANFAINLDDWNFSNNLFTGTIPSQISSMNRLRFWYFQNNSFSGSIPSQISMLKRLEFLNWSNNQFSGTLPSSLGLLESLKVWQLSHNRFTGTIPSQIARQQNLESWFLADNAFEGSIPTELGLLEKFKHLDASQNRLTGSLPLLPSTIEYVILHQNRLTGELHRNYGSLVSLRALTLFDNYISGSVPPLPQSFDVLLLFNNLLSCSLPSQKNSNRDNINSTRLLAVGNAFPLDGWPDQIDTPLLLPWESDAAQLFVPYPRPWVWLVILLTSCGVILFVLLSLRCLVPLASRYQQHDMSQELATMTTNVETHIRTPARVVAVGAPPVWRTLRDISLGMTATMTAYITALNFVPRMHECADPLNTMTLAEARFSFSHGSFGVALACAVIHAVCSIVVVARLCMRGTRTEATIPDAYDSPAPSTVRHPRQRQVWFSVISVFAWLLILAVLHVPVLIYLAIESLPSNNVRPWVVILLRALVVPWLLFSAEWITPEAVSRLSCRGSHRSKFIDLTVGLIQRSDSSLDSPRQNGLIAFSQFILLIIAPVVSQLILYSRCAGAIFTRFWNPCQQPDTFNLSAFRPASRATPAVTVQVLADHDVCRSHFDSMLCNREVMTSIASLIIFKIALQTLVVLLRALFLMVFERVAKVSRGRTKAWWWFVTPSEQSATRSMSLLLLLGFALGGFAPLVWPLVTFCIQSTMLLWSCSNQRGDMRTGLLSHRVLWLGVAAQIGFGAGFVLVNVES
eukprot:c14799_g1_i1.p1 GENE.c14799_g1_i1~~c14799_g1_i1.p1  ORF type:complete len:907 (+),score=150.52 c14799_g1_i1:39-2759(+)